MQKLTQFFIIFLLTFEVFANIEQQIERSKRVIEQLQQFIAVQITEYCSSKNQAKRKEIETKINTRRYDQAQKRKQIDRLLRKKITSLIVVPGISQKLKIKTKTMVGQEINVFVNENDTIRKLKQKLSIRLGLNIDQIILKISKEGKLIDLENDKTFRFYDVKEKDPIHVVWKIEFKPIQITCP